MVWYWFSFIRKSKKGRTDLWTLFEGGTNSLNVEACLSYLETNLMSSYVITHHHVKLSENLHWRESTLVDKPAELSTKDYDICPDRGVWETVTQEVTS